MSINVLILHLNVQLCEQRHIERTLGPESGMGNPRGPAQLLLVEQLTQNCSSFVNDEYSRVILSESFIHLSTFLKFPLEQTH